MSLALAGLLGAVGESAGAEVKRRQDLEDERIRADRAFRQDEARAIRAEALAKWKYGMDAEIRKEEREYKRAEKLDDRAYAEAHKAPRAPSATQERLNMIDTLKIPEAEKEKLRQRVIAGGSYGRAADSLNPKDRIALQEKAAEIREVGIDETNQALYDEIQAALGNDVGGGSILEDEGGSTITTGPAISPRLSGLLGELGDAPSLKRASKPASKTTPPPLAESADMSFFGATNTEQEMEGLRQASTEELEELKRDIKKSKFKNDPAVKARLKAIEEELTRR